MDDDLDFVNDEDIDDGDWTPPVRKQKPKRRMSSFVPRKVSQSKNYEDEGQDDWCIPKRRKSCYVFDRKGDSEEEDDEPITIDKVLGFLNGDDDLIKFSSSSPILKPKSAPKDNDARESTSYFKDLYNDTKKRKSYLKDLNSVSRDASKTRHNVAKKSTSHVKGRLNDGKEGSHLRDLYNDDDVKSKSKTESDLFNTDENEKYQMNVSVEVEENTCEEIGKFDEDTASETIELPEIPPSDDDEDLTDVFGASKPIITSVTSLRHSSNNSDTSIKQNGNNLDTSLRHSVVYVSNRSDSEDVDVLSDDEHSNKELHDEKKTNNRNTNKKHYTHDNTVIQGHGDLLTPIRYEAVYEPRTRRNPKPKCYYQDDDFISPKLKERRRRRKCHHCDVLFYREDLDNHLNQLNTANNKIIDKLLQIPVVKIVDVAKDKNLDPKLKARLKDIKSKMENRSANYSLRHCVHCEKAFVTSRQLNNHIVDVIFGLKVLRRKDGLGTSRLLDYKIKFVNNNVETEGATVRVGTRKLQSKT